MSRFTHLKSDRPIVAVVSIVLLACASPALADSWSAGPNLATARTAASATLLANGKVLATGGVDTNSNPIAVAELYDPASNSWTAAGSLKAARDLHTATLLSNGKVLVAGGASGSTALATAELYDPATNTWSAAASLSTARTGHSATLLANGKVLVAGGASSGGTTAYATAELYDPASNTWATAGSLATGRFEHTATLLANGKVLVAGGVNSGATTAFASAEIYDPTANGWSVVGSLATGRGFHTATLLPGGKVLVAGGATATTTLSSAELYDPATSAWSAAGSLASARALQTATLLTGGKVLLAGGVDTNFRALASAELYAPTANTWSTAASFTTARGFHTATLLSTGKVLAAGGLDVGSKALASTELHTATSGSVGATPQSGYWWNPAEGGRGFTIEQSGTSGNLFFATYLYDASGRGLWYAAGPAPMNGSSFSAPMASFSGGQTLTGAFKQATQGTSPGNVSIAFSDASHGTLTWPGGTIPIQRYEFLPNGLNSPPTSAQPQSGYWWNPAEGGRGYTIEVQNNVAFVAAYMYDGSGNPVWYASGPAALTGDNVYQGNWSSYTGGETLTGSYRAPTGTANAGNLTIQFASPTAGTLTLPDGRQIPIQRYGF